MKIFNDIYNKFTPLSVKSDEKTRYGGNDHHTRSNDTNLDATN